MIEPQEISLPQVFATLDRGVTVVTGNKRLAGALRRAYEQAAMDRGREVWPTPDLLPWSAWLHRTWEEVVLGGAATAGELLLTSPQEQWVWEAIITANMVDRPLQQVPGTVRRVQQAWQLIQSWRLPWDAAVFRYNIDSAAFWEWATEFEARCARNGWLPLARLGAELQRRIRAGDLAVPGELMLIGFDELTPRQQSLLSTLAGSGCELRWVRLMGKKSRVARSGCADGREEALTAARWARRWLDEKPGARIGIVVPDLASQRELLIHALDRILAPRVLSPGCHSGARPYNISLGAPLSTYPLVRTALRLLDLLASSIDLEKAGGLLRSPFLAGWEREAGTRALLDARLRETGELHVAVKTLHYHAAQPDRPYSCPALAQRLGAWIGIARNLPCSARPGQWAEWFTQLLSAVGWANGRPLSSEEYQAAEAWHELLGVFAALEPVTGSLGAAAAVAQLWRLAGERTFQPQTGAVPVQVLGMLEAGGLRFDCLWVMGLHDGMWPASPRPNPFIPLPLQRDAGLPHSSEERELRVARTVTRRILTSATEVVVSFPQRSGDEQLRPSPLIAALPLVDSRALRLWPAMRWRDAVHAGARLVPLAQDPAPPLENREAGGGSKVFKLQAACPFRAFAELRLGARPLEPAEIGLNAKTRGTLMHRILERIWRALNSHERLLSLEATGLEALVQALVDEAIEEAAGRHPQAFTARFRELEAGRLRRQALEWLELERRREPFRVVEKERKYSVTAGGVRVRLKIDRIDELAAGRRVVIDYKTGEVKPRQWFGERPGEPPEEPQLLLYSMALGGDVSGVLFAQVKAGAMAFKGVVAEAGLVPGAKTYKELPQTRQMNSWAEVLGHWRTAMERLGESFCRGDAAVKPRKYPDTCAHCGLGPLCRIDELRALGGPVAGADRP